MSILVKPYKISVWEDVWSNAQGKLVESRIAIIGSNEMEAQCRALEPTLTRNVNGTKKLSFKMYKHYIDTMTGEKTTNPFIDWLIAERKVKLEYDGKWYDFVIKNISENSSNYLYTYELEDALVQELSKNGFGVTLDAQLMNNLGDAGELGSQVLKETDWSVQSEIFVQTVDEALVYITIPAGTQAMHIKDQTDLSQGVLVEPYTFTEDKTGLAFYSCCQNKPHRFQFIYSSNGYNKVDGVYKINRDYERKIIEKDCQYYIDIDDPSRYVKKTKDGLEIFLPTLPTPPTLTTVSFDFGTPGASYKNCELDNDEASDSCLSSWYRGARYGYAQQSQYIPLLERYCQKFKREEAIYNIESLMQLHYENAIGENGNQIVSIEKNGTTYTKRTPYSGIKLVMNYENDTQYDLSYDIEITGGTLETLGGHKKSFNTKSFKVFNSLGNEVEGSYNDTTGTYSLPENSYTTLHVVVSYKKIALGTFNIDNVPYIFIQPNRGSSTEVSFKITNIELHKGGEYFGYTESKFISPTLVHNCINNYKFESTAGWTATANSDNISGASPKVENLYGILNESGNFVSVVDDFYAGQFDVDKKYTSYLKMTFDGANQFVLNSGPRDNRTLIKQMAKDEEWVLDYKIVNVKNENRNGDFDFSLGEYGYKVESGGYDRILGNISFSSRSTLTKKEEANIPNGNSRIIFKVEDTSFNEESFSKDSKVYLKISPKSGIDGTSWYIEQISLYRKSVGEDGKIIVPDESQDKNVTAETYVETGVIEHIYNYFDAEAVAKGSDITDAKYLPLIKENSLSYTKFKPVYNEDARKVRTVTVKESNYFNILQSIAETFEAWLELEVKRDDPSQPGAITQKIAKFKNYAGKYNAANFRYGVNLVDIQRTFASNNIVTKLIVKQNYNELAKDGFCTIQRAGANPTGENYIYDFQYYQNMGIMNVKDYLDTVYYIDDACGDDYVLWDNDNDNKKVSKPDSDNPANIKGYYSRVKKINAALQPIAQEVAGLNKTLTEKKAKYEVEKATQEASTQGIEQVRKDFHFLTGLYPEEAQSGNITGITEVIITPKDEWFEVDSYGIEGTKVTVALKLSNYLASHGIAINVDQNTIAKTIQGGYSIEKEYAWTGLETKVDWTADTTYVLEYDIKSTGNDGTFVNIGGHNTGFKDVSVQVWKDYGTSNPTNIIIKTDDNTVWTPTDSTTFGTNVSYHVIFTATVNGENPELWIQPNRGISDKFIGEITNIKLSRQVTAAQATKNYDRTAYFTLSAEVAVSTDDSSSKIKRTYSLSCPFPKKAQTATTECNITSIDTTRTDIQKYIDEYTTYFMKKSSADGIVPTLKTEIDGLELQIKNKSKTYETYLDYKTKLNRAFFSKYSRFIQEGTWMSDEYTDDEKYYADAQSVLYNSCYPQVGYSINVLSLRGLPGYEMIDFDIGDKTLAIDEQFFGDDHEEEVIIAEMQERLDDPSKNTIRVQNFKNQFQDLFQKITATTQQAQYNSGAYEKGAALVDANAKKKSEFITNAINDAQGYLNHGQTVKTGADGITITDDSDKQNKLRLVGGAILFSATDEQTQEQTWMTGITKDGISANLVTAGRLDTGAVQIMSGNEPVFRWDEYGISAYDALWANGDGIQTISGIDSKKFVRFDKNGIYGVDNAPGIDGATWHPQNAAEVKNNAAFYLTWDGMSVMPEHLIYRNGNPNSTGISPNQYQVRLGRVDDYIFNAWDSTGIPKYEEGRKMEDNPDQEAPKFVKVFSVGEKASIGADSINEQFVIYSDGTVVAKDVKFTGQCQWVETSSPSKNIYRKGNANKPTDGTLYSGFPNSDTEQSGAVWHKIWNSEKDTHYCHTDDGGATWTGPFLITGRSIQSTDTFYGVGPIGLTDGELDGWLEPGQTTEEPIVMYSLRREVTSETTGESEQTSTQWYKSISEAGEVKSGQCLYIKTRDNYNDGTKYEKYLASMIVPHNYSIVLTNDSGVVVTNDKGEADDDAYGENVTTTVEIRDGNKVVEGWTISPQPSTGLTYSQVEGKKDTYKVTSLTPDSGQIVFTATGPKDKGEDNITLTTTFPVSKLKQGTPGDSGAINCYIDSSVGSLLLDTYNNEVKLTARIFEGQTEIDKDGKLWYNWYIEENDGSDSLIGGEDHKNDEDFHSREISLAAGIVKNQTIYFTAEENLRVKRRKL